jgi:hypothetical protein
MQTTAKYLTPTPVQEMAGSLMDAMMRKDRKQRKITMNQFVDAVMMITLMPVKTLKMIVRRETSHNKITPREQRTNALAIIRSFLDNRDKFIASLQKHGYTNGIFSN